MNDGKLPPIAVSPYTDRIVAAVRKQDCADPLFRILEDYARACVEAALESAREDTERLDYLERTFSGMTNRERYLPVKMVWGVGCNGRTLREACDKYMYRDAAMKAAGSET